MKKLFVPLIFFFFFGCASAPPPVSSVQADSKPYKIDRFHPSTPFDSYAVTVDYSQPLADMITAGGYDWVHEEITKKYLPFEARSIEEVKLQLFLWRGMTNNQIFAELNKLGLRPANPPELLALGAKHPEISENHCPIVALGSRWSTSDDIGALLLYENRGRRKLRLNWYSSDYRWDDVVIILAVSK